MGKVDRLCNRVQPFAALFWALGIETWPCPSARHSSMHRRTQSMSLYGWRSWFNSQRRRVASPPRFSCLGMLLIFGLYYKCNNFVLIHYEDGSIYLGLLLMTGWLHGNNSRPHYCVLYCHLNNISTFLSVTAVLWYVGGKRCQKVWSIRWPCVPVSISWKIQEYFDPARLLETGVQ